MTTTVQSAPAAAPDLAAIKASLSVPVLTDIHEAAQVMTVAWYNEGARVLDISGLTGVTIGGTQVSGDGVREIGSARFPDSDAWSAKTPRIHPATGDFYLYANASARGLDIWKFEGAGKRSAKPGRWMTGADAQAYLADRRVDLPSDYALLCLTPQ